MREIKFRAWWAEQRIMHEFGLGQDYFKHCFSPVDEENYTCELEYATAIMQYTGLKDKNGKEIYEGDVVSDGKIKSKVFWGKYSLRLYHINTVKTSHPGSEWMPFRFEGDYEVIGNIYENPELCE
jgi:uncharacterized phage protein (TIGR01671 family)